MKAIAFSVIVFFASLSAALADDDPNLAKAIAARDAYADCAYRHAVIEARGTASAPDAADAAITACNSKADEFLNAMTDPPLGMQRDAALGTLGDARANLRVKVIKFIEDQRKK